VWDDELLSELFYLCSACTPFIFDEFEAFNINCIAPFIFLGVGGLEPGHEVVLGERMQTRPTNDLPPHWFDSFALVGARSAVASATTDPFASVHSNDSC
jgi:hypothetical protein